MIFKGQWAEIIGTEMIVGQDESGGLSFFGQNADDRSKRSWNDKKEIGAGKGYFEEEGYQIVPEFTFFILLGDN
jgi:hypothetical protein